MKVLEQKVLNKVIVIKFGGNALNIEALKSFSNDINQLILLGAKIVVVHGGGPQINEILEKFKIKSKFIEGFRFTDAKTMEVVEMVLTGKVGNFFVDSFSSLGIKSISLSGKDASTILAKKKVKYNGNTIDLGFVGEVDKINTDLLNILLSKKIIPVLAPVALDKLGVTLNINADCVAASVARALEADYFIMMTNIDNILDENKKPIYKISAQQVRTLIDEKVISDGMIPKTLAALNSLDRVKQVTIINGAKTGTLIESFLNNSIGTKIV